MWKSNEIIFKELIAQCSACLRCLICLLERKKEYSCLWGNNSDDVDADDGASGEGHRGSGDGEIAAINQTCIFKISSVSKQPYDTAVVFVF